MTKHSMTDRTDDHGKRTEPHRSRALRSRIVRLGLLSLVLVFALGNIRCPPPDGAPSIICQNFEIRVAPGTCEFFDNPCYPGIWLGIFSLESIGLDHTGEEIGVSIRSTITDVETTREICVGPGSPLLVNEHIDFVYSRGSDYGIGSLTLTTVPQPTPTPTPVPTPTPASTPTPTPEPTPTPTPMTASFVFNVTCCPYSLNLDASASTGPIVSYTWDVSWTPANPDRVTTTPTTSIQFMEGNTGTIRLTVTDAGGNTATASRGVPF